jgi:hypothetical protein
LGGDVTVNPIKQRRATRGLIIAMSLLPGLPFLLAELLIPSYIPPLLGLLVFAPVGEEAFKLLLAFGLMGLWSWISGKKRADVSLRVRDLFFP